VRINAIRTRRLCLPLEPPFDAAWDPIPRRSLEATLVFVETDEGLIGVGSGDTMDGFARFEHLFVGEDPLVIDRHVRVLETIAVHAGRYWPLEAALWDIAGQAAGRTVAELFGGRAMRLPAYASLGEARDGAARSEAVLALAEEGFRAVKLRIDRDRVREGIASVARVREAVGARMDIMVDLNEGWRMPGDIAPPLDEETVRNTAGELRELGILWLEEPLPAASVRAYAELRRSSGVRIAGGEFARTPAELLAFLEADALDVYQPDAVCAVGLQRAREVAELAHDRGLWYTPHTWTNGIGLIVNLHVAAGVGARPYLEFPYDPPGWTPERRDFMLAEPLRLDADGCVAVPDRPGLGIALDDDALRRYAAD
jgi:D-galactarolactone cycloisomerase